MESCLSQVGPLQGGNMQADDILLTSPHNPRVKEIIRLREKRDRDKSNKFLIEGYRELLRFTDANRNAEELYICKELFLGENEELLISRIKNKGARIIPCSESVFRKISYRDRPDGLLAVAQQKHLSLGELEKQLKEKPNPFLVIAEAIEKPGNLGTILRSSDAVGVDALIVCDRCTDIHNPNVVRASVGTLFTVPVIEAEGQTTLNWIKANGISILAATPSAKKEFTEVNMKQPIAIVVGTEQLGLSERWLNEATIQVRIPMCGIADSLNVAMATTLLLYEALRQRRI